MASYAVKVSKVGGHTFPTLLGDFAEWLKTKPHGSVGYFDFVTEKIPKEWSPKDAKRLQTAAFSFLLLPDGSLVALLTHDAKAPPAVVLLGSEGESSSLAPTLEAFLFDLAKGETGVMELDEEAAGRKALADFLKKKKVKAPKAKAFDFDAWLSGDAATSATKGTKPAPPPMTKEIAALAPKLRELAALVGRRADDEELLAYIAKTLGKKAPKNTTVGDDTSYVVAAPKGVELCFSHRVGFKTQNPKYPPIAATPRSFTPYLVCAWLREKFVEPLPDGVTAGMPLAELEQKLAAPTRRIGMGSLNRPVWEKTLDAERDVVFAVEGWSSAKGAVVSVAIRGS